jgi:hypothetical protein
MATLCHTPLRLFNPNLLMLVDYHPCSSRFQSWSSVLILADPRDVGHVALI